MEAFAILGFVFGIMELMAFIQIQKLTKTLKEKGILEENHKEEQCTKQIYSITIELLTLKSFQFP